MRLEPNVLSPLSLKEAQKPSQEVLRPDPLNLLSTSWSRFELSSQAVSDRRIIEFVVNRAVSFSPPLLNALLASTSTAYTVCCLGPQMLLR